MRALEGGPDCRCGRGDSVQGVAVAAAPAPRPPARRGGDNPFFGGANENVSFMSGRVGGCACAVVVGHVVERTCAVHNMLPT